MNTSGVSDDETMMGSAGLLKTPLIAPLAIFPIKQGAPTVALGIDWRGTVLLLLGQHWLRDEDQKTSVLLSSLGRAGMLQSWWLGPIPWWRCLVLKDSCVKAPEKPQGQHAVGTGVIMWGLQSASSLLLPLLQS